ncbi:MAG: hypothetical protein L6R42_004761 [Xanthoria sp. 1 TBL-2021]|nr:MAG: hypothetical protein L6R42_004761 [Xanthoria sp. 1 TBL-2021]
MTASGRRRGINPLDSNDEFDIDVQKLDELHEIVSEQLERVIRSDPGSLVYLAALSGYDLELNKLEARIWGWTEEMERIRGAHGKLRKGLRHWGRGYEYVDLFDACEFHPRYSLLELSHGTPRRETILVRPRYTILWPIFDSITELDQGHIQSIPHINSCFPRAKHEMAADSRYEAKVHPSMAYVIISTLCFTYRFIHRVDPVTRYYRDMRYLEGLDTLHHHTKSMYVVDNHVGNQLHLIKSNASGTIDPLMKSAFMLEIENLRSKSRAGVLNWNNFETSSRLKKRSSRER